MMTATMEAMATDAIMNFSDEETAGCLRLSILAERETA